MISIIDLSLEIFNGLLAVIIAGMIYKNKGELNIFSWGFILIALGGVLDVLDEFISGEFLDLSTGAFIMVGLIFIILGFVKMKKSGD